MIKYFDSFYGGHVSSDNLGFSGIPVDLRRETDHHLAQIFDYTLEIAKIMDSTGFDTLWLSEHHFQREGFGGIPNTLLLSIYLAQKTKDLNFGGWFNIVPIWHPLRIAEDFASADIITKGRIKFGIGRGYIAREVETLGSPLLDKEANRELFEEQFEIILKSWNTSSFSHKGKHYQIPAPVPHRHESLTNITLVPRPINLPVECWQPIQGGSEGALNFMALHNIKGVIAGGTAKGGSAKKTAEKYQEALSRKGKTTILGENLALAVNFYIDDSMAKAEKKAELAFQESLKVLGPLGVIPGLTSEQISELKNIKGVTNTDGLPTLKNAIKEGSWICGTPEHIVEKIKDIEERFPGLERISMGAGHLGIGPKSIVEILSHFGEKVIPVFKT